VLDLSLNFVCPVCHARPEIGCRNPSGVVLSQSHLERKWLAVDQLLGRAPQFSAMRSKRVARLARKREAR